MVHNYKYVFSESSQNLNCYVSKCQHRQYSDDLVLSLFLFVYRTDTNFGYRPSDQHRFGSRTQSTVYSSSK